MHRLFSLLLLLLFLVPVVRAQQAFDFRLRSDIPIRHNGTPLPDAWAGGLNSPQFSTIDLNHDGVDDVFVFDRTHYKIFTFLAVQEAGRWQYRHAPAYEVLFPPMRAWALLRDYNCDGLKDIFTRGDRGISVYKQVLTAAGRVSFEVAHEVLYFDTNVNLFVGVEDLPAITDMDGDGDLDILAYEWSSGLTIDLYTNLQAEQNLPCGELKFTRTADMWGNITRCAGICNSYLFGGWCRLAKPLHVGGSSLLAIDLNGDGIKDVLMGHENCADLVSMYNTGTAKEAKFSAHQKNIPGQIAEGTLGYFPAAYYEDVTFDGVKDLIVAPNATLNEHENVDMAGSVWVYPNGGTNAVPRFDRPRQPFLQHRMLDLGEGAAPAFADLDGDGDLDMLVGNYARADGSRYVSSLRLYRNTGSATSPAFALEDSDYLGLSSLNLLSLNPVFADLNGDGALDLVFTSTHAQTLASKIHYILNTAPADQPAAYVRTAIQDVRGLSSAPFDKPFFFDVDGDGKHDVLLGLFSGALHYYRNTGTNASPSYSLVSTSFGGIAADFTRRMLNPVVTDLDQDGQPDLVTVDDSGLLRIYPSFRQHIVGTFPEPQIEVFYNPLLQTLQEGRLGRWLAVAAADITGSGFPELVIGNQGGGLAVWSLSGEPLPPPPPEQPLATWLLYPNPASDSVSVRSPEPVRVQLYDTTGRLVYTSTDPLRENHRIPVRGLRAGLYLVRVTNLAGRSEGRTLLVR